MCLPMNRSGGIKERGVSVGTMIEKEKKLHNFAYKAIDQEVMVQFWQVMLPIHFLISLAYILKEITF